jgi:N4-gp56 family major capsid protein
MAAATTTNPADFSNRTQTLFNPKLLKSLLFNLKLAQFGLSEGYTAIGDTIRFFRPRKANLSGINAQAITFAITPLVTPTSLAEGVKPTNLTEVGIGYVDIKLTQRAGYAELTDRLQAIDLLNTLKVYTERMGADAALDYDTVIRNQLINGLYGSDNADANGNDGGYFERFAGVANTGVSATDYATELGLSKSNAKITRAEHLKVITQLKTSKIPKINDRYVVLTTPQVIHDIRQDTTWVQTGTFQAKDQLFKDMSIELDGGVFIEQNNPWVEGTTYGTESATDPGDGLVYSNIYLGADAFGIPNLSNKMAGGTQSAPRLIILNQPDKADPINQKTTLGWKSFFGAGAFIATTNGTTRFSGERPRYAILRCKSTFA